MEIQNYKKTIIISIISALFIIFLGIGSYFYFSDYFKKADTISGLTTKVNNTSYSDQDTNKNEDNMQKLKAKEVSGEDSLAPSKVPPTPAF